ncbi:MAG: hypothetical protein KF832_15075 [Caldilineaceae bacterium]|nr:hypothetical protein [Caldilineaceae bacterium]
MTEQLEILITLLIYTLFFAWIGYQRGNLREAIVAFTALGSWIVLQEAGDILIRIVNLGSKGVAFVRAGGLGENTDAAFSALGDAPAWVTSDQRDEFLFLVWVLILVLAYVISNLKPFAKKSKSDGWAVLLGIFNGLLFAAILLPKLATLVQPSELDENAAAGIGSLFRVLSGGIGLLRDSVGGLWGIFDASQRSLVLLILLTIFLLLAASTLRNSSKKPSSAEKRS